MARIKDRLKALITALGGEPVGETDGPLLTELEEAVENGSGGGGGGITPTGELNIVANGDNDVTNYASVHVAVPAYLVQFDANGGSGSVTPLAVAYGDIANLPVGGMTPPEGKTQVGWALTSDSETALANYKPQSDVTLYAVYVGI
jgi:hypothetical protein